MSGRKLKLFWIGDDLRGFTGYGRVARELLTRVSNQYDVVQYSIGCPPQTTEETYYQGIKVINSADGTSFGTNKLPGVFTRENPDILVIINDHKTVQGLLEVMVDNKCDLSRCRVLPYVSTEYVGIPAKDMVIYNQVTHHLLVMANFTRDEFLKVGYQQPVTRLSHGYSDQIKRIDAKEARLKMGLNPEAFVFFSGSKNQPRKRLDILIRAFVHFLVNHQGENVILLMNCGLIDIGWNLPQLYDRLTQEYNIQDPGEHLFFCGQNTGGSQKNDADLSVIYSACDVGVTTSTGESFGLIPFEQASLGIPQIIPRWSGMMESVKVGCIMVETSDYYVYPVCLQSAGGEARLVNYKDMAKAMERYYSDRELLKRDRKLVKKNVEGYTWDEMSHEFVKILEEVTGSSSGGGIPVVVAGVNDVRTDRRQMAVFEENSPIKKTDDVVEKKEDSSPVGSGGVDCDLDALLVNLNKHCTADNKRRDTVVNVVHRVNSNLYVLDNLD